MMSLPILGSDMGLQLNKKPFLLPDKAFQELNNAYVWRDRVKIREGIFGVGPLQRNFTTISFYASANPTFSFNLLVQTGFVKNVTQANPGVVTTTYPHNLTNGKTVVFSNVGGMTALNGTTNGPYTVTVISSTTFSIGVDTSMSPYNPYTSGGSFISNQALSSTEPEARLIPGSFSITFNSATFTDQGNGLIMGPNASNYGTINYSSGAVSITNNQTASSATSLTYSYAPGLPVMGLLPREQGTLNDEQTIGFDTKYAYIFTGSIDSGGSWGEFIPGTTWGANDYNFFEGCNFRGSAAGSRYFFVTNDFSSATNTMYYTATGGSWTVFNPAVDSSNFLFGALFLVPYYGRLCAFNTIEGASVSAQSNIFNRARFAAIGDPTGSNAWRTDIFGQGGFIDAPVNEAITGVEFVKNTLIVTFEYSTWQFRYVGEYGLLPFIWERTSADYGNASPGGTVLFNDHLETMGDRAIIGANAIDTNRIDNNVPDIVFDVNNAENGQLRVQGVRDYQKELVYWTYNDAIVNPDTYYFPNTVLVYNYRNGTFAKNRDNITCFGTFQTSSQTTWDSQSVTWDSESVTWTDVTTNTNYPYIIAGNQQGYTYLYGYSGQTNNQRNDVYYQISAVNLSAIPYVFTIPNHNLQSSEFIYVADLNFIDTGTNPPTALSCSLNNTIYKIMPVDANNVSLLAWNGEKFANDFTITFTPTPITPTYMGGGMCSQLPVLYVQTKDFSPFQEKGLQCKHSYTDFLMDATTAASMTIEVYQNTSLISAVNVPIGQQDPLETQQELETYLPSPFYVPGSDIAWHRFYSTVAGQYISLAMTFDDLLMSNITTHQQNWTLNAMNLHFRPGGKMVF